LKTAGFQTPFALVSNLIACDQIAHKSTRSRADESDLEMTFPPREGDELQKNDKPTRKSQTNN
jgi:hypothetical protein